MSLKAAGAASRRSGKRAPRAAPDPVPDPAPSGGGSPALDLGRTARRLRESQNLTLADVAPRY